MSLLSGSEINEARKKGDIEIDPFDEGCLQGASYDMRLGERAIITKTISLKSLKSKLEEEAMNELDVEKKGSISIPAGGFALVTTLEKIRLGNNYVGHIGLSSYYGRKGLAILSGLQIDPGWDGVLVLGLCNLSARSIFIDYKSLLCTIEIHRLSRAVEPFAGSVMEEQRKRKIPKIDRDYLRTIETMSVSDLTQALISISSSVDQLSKQMRLFWIPIGLLAVMAMISIIIVLLR
ncbi:MAG: dCTP deaminase [candidate division WOR-3 bacterium]|nr:dCTP deaminase [candidate division WOR-3 bacterium]